MIGYSQDYDVCQGKTYVAGGAKNAFCNEFVNKSVESICDRHKHE